MGLAFLKVFVLAISLAIFVQAEVPSNDEILKESWKAMDAAKEAVEDQAEALSEHVENLSNNETPKDPSAMLDKVNSMAEAVAGAVQPPDLKMGPLVCWFSGDWGCDWLSSSATTKSAAFMTISSVIIAILFL